MTTPDPSLPSLISPASLPYSQASENNKQPILDVLRLYLQGPLRVLEIGSGTAQHGEFFTGQLPALHWQCSDLPEALATTRQRIAAADRPSLPPPVALDVNNTAWDYGQYDCIFSANSLHIMSCDSVENFFQGIGSCLNEKSWLLLYGPFRYNGAFTTESNARFDVWLKQRDPVSGIRDFEWISQLAGQAGLSFVKDHAMPANNQLLVFSNSSPST